MGLLGSFFRRGSGGNVGCRTRRKQPGPVVLSLRYLHSVALALLVMILSSLAPPPIFAQIVENRLPAGFTQEDLDGLCWGQTQQVTGVDVFNAPKFQAEVRCATTVKDNKHYCFCEIVVLSTSIVGDAVNRVTVHLDTSAVLKEGPLLQFGPYASGGSGETALVANGATSNPLKLSWDSMPGGHRLHVGETVTLWWIRNDPQPLTDYQMIDGGVGLGLFEAGTCTLPAPVIADDGDSITLGDALTASWSVEDFNAVEYAYAIGITPADPGGDYLVGWTSVGPSTSVSLADLPLEPGMRYYWYVKAMSSDGLWSEVGVSDGVRILPSGRIIRVKWDSPGDGPGDTWAHAFRSIQAAINSAEAEDEIWVAGEPGYPYRENLGILVPVRMYGGFQGTESQRSDRNPAQHETIVESVTSSDPVFGINTQSTIPFEVDGFTIRRGESGIHSNSSVVITNNLIVENGDGIYVHGPPTNNNVGITLSHNTIKRNTGRGMYCVGHDVTITSNVAFLNGWTGAEVTSTGTAIICSNSLYSNGRHGLLLIARGTNATTVACNVANSNAAYGMLLATFVDASVVVDSNSASGNGQYGMYLQGGGQDGVVNNTVTANTYGGVIIADAGQVANNIIAHNGSGITGYGTFPLVRNCVYNPIGADYVGCEPGPTDILQDPRLSAVRYGDMRLGSDSPCIDAGNNGFVVGAVDIDGHARVIGSAIDIGAHEYGAEQQVPYEPHVVRVSPEGVDDQLHDGSRWSLSKRSLAAGIEAAKAAGGGEVWVAAGEYNLDNLVVVPAYVHLYGGFAGTEVARNERDWADYPSILQRNKPEVEISLRSGHGVSTLDGFDVRGAQISAVGSPFVENNSVSGSYRYGIYCAYAAVVRRNHIRDTHEQGVVAYGSSLVMSNIITDVPGGIGAFDEAQIIGNRIERAGTGIECTAAPIVVSNVVCDSVTGLRASFVSGSHRPRIIGNTFTGNRSGVGVERFYYGAEFVGNVIAFSSSSGIYGNWSPASPEHNAYNCVFNPGADDGYTPGKGDLQVDPLFVSRGSGDFHLQQLSPCIDACMINPLQGEWIDIDGEERVLNAQMDMGADEYSAPRDPTPPLRPEVIDDGQYTTSMRSLHAEWVSTDPESEVEEYLYSIGTDPLGQEEGGVLQWRSAGAARGATETDLVLEEGRTYYWYVKARNSVGLWSNIGISNGITVDTTPPVTVVSLGPGDGAFACGEPVRFEWVGTDHLTPASELQYSWRVDHSGWSAWSLMTSYEFCALDDGFHLLEVKARDLAGNEEIDSAARDFNLDTAGPVIVDAQAEPSYADAMITWTINEGAKCQVEYRGTSGNGWIITPPADLVAGAQSASLSELDCGATYQFRVRAWDACGHATVSAEGSFTTLDDQSAPDTRFIAGPAEGVVVCSVPVSFEWVGVDDVATSHEITYAVRLDAGEWLDTGSTVLYVLHNLIDGVHVFEVKAKDAAGNEDLTPASRSFIVDTTAPSIIGIASSVTASSATITWKTDEPALGQVDYGNSVYYGMRTELSQTLSTSHAAVLPGLAPGAVYHYRIRSSDACGHSSTSSDHHITTAPDATPPETLITDGPTDGQIACATTVTFGWTGSDSEVSRSALTYSWRLNGSAWSTSSPETGTVLEQLEDGLNVLEVRASDPSGNTDPTPALASFRVDTSLPVAEDVFVTLQRGKATVNWRTNKGTNAQVQYGRTGAYGQWSPAYSDMETAHAVTLTGLDQNSTYHYRIYSTDLCGRDLGDQPDRTFSTGMDSQPPDTIILEGVAEGAQTCPHGIKFAFTALDDFTAPESLLFYWQIDSGPWEGPEAANSAEMPTLDHGTHTFKVAAVDAAGNIDQTPATRRFTVDGTEPVILNVRVEHVGAATATVNWETDGPATSLVEYRRLPDGLPEQTQFFAQYAIGHAIMLNDLAPGKEYEYRVLSRDQCDRESASERRVFETTSDGQDPDTTIVSGPRDGGAIRPGQITFAWTGSDNATPVHHLKYQYQLDGSGWEPVPESVETSRTLTVELLGLHTLEVRSVDEAGHYDKTPALSRFYVDVDKPSISTPAVTNVTHISATVGWHTDEPTTGIVEYALATGDFRFAYSDPVLTDQHSLAIGPLNPDTAYRVRVRARDEAGNEGVSDECTFVSSKLHDAAVDAQSIAFFPEVPTVGGSVTMSAMVNNYGDLPLSFTAVFYDWTERLGSTEISRKHLELVPPHSSIEVASGNWTITSEGQHVPWVELVDVVPQDDIPANNSAGKAVIAGPPPYRLALGAPLVRTWVGHESLFTVLVQNIGSRPQQITNAQITGVPWASLVSDVPRSDLQPGEELQLTFLLNVPSGETGGDGTNPIIRTAIVEITGTEIYTHTFVVEVYRDPQAELYVTVLDSETGLPVPKAVVATGSNDAQWFTDTAGTVAIPCTTGAQTVSAVAQNYLPQYLDVEVASGAHPVVLRLQPGSPLEIRDISVEPLTLSEIQDRGISLQDPANSWVYDFILHMNFAAVPVRNVILPTSPTPGQHVSPGYIFPEFTPEWSGPGPSPTGPNNLVLKPEIYYPTSDPTQRIETWIILPGDVRLSKQFWEATVYIRNRCNAPFHLDNVEASIQLPSGISLPDLNGIPQDQTHAIGHIPAQTERQAQWILRGDAAGTYSITGMAAGDLALGGSTVRLEASLVSPDFEIVQPKLDVLFTLPECVAMNEEFTVGAKVTNRSSVVLNSVMINVAPQRLLNAHLAQGQTATVGVGQLGIGETKEVPVRFVSEINGMTNGLLSYATADPNLSPEVAVFPFDGIRLNKTVTPKLAPPGAQVQYVIEVENTTPLSAFNIRIEDVLPEYLDYIDAGGPHTAEIDLERSALLWELRELGPAERTTLIYRAQIAPDTPLCTELSNSCYRLTPCSTTAGSSECTLVVDVPNRPHLSVSNSPSSDLVAAGDVLEYAISVSNQGATEAVDVVVESMIGSACSYIEGSAGTAPTLDAPQESLQWYIPRLSVGETWDTTYSVRIESTSSEWVVNSLSASSVGTCTAVSTVVTPTAQVRGSNLLRANMHVHSWSPRIDDSGNCVSDKDHYMAGSTMDVLRDAAEVGLDAITLNNHGEYLTNMTGVCDYLLYGGLSKREWDNELEACANAPVVALRAFEWSGRPGAPLEHINVIGTSFWTGTHLNPLVDPENRVVETPDIRTSGSAAGLYDWMAAEENRTSVYGGTIVGQFNHVALPEQTPFDEFEYDADAAELIRLLEIGSGQLPRPIPGSYGISAERFHIALNNGWRVAPTIGVDNQSRLTVGPRVARHRFTGVYTANRNQEAFIDALRQRSLFSSEDGDFVLTFDAELDGAEYSMGRVIQTTKGSGQINLHIVGSNSDDEIGRVEVWRGNSITGEEPALATGVKAGSTERSNLVWVLYDNWPWTNKSTFDLTASADFIAGDWFYVSVEISKATTQAHAYSAPVWVDGPASGAGRVKITAVDSFTGEFVAGLRYLLSRKNLSEEVAESSLLPPAIYQSGEATGSEGSTTGQEMNELSRSIAGRSLSDGVMMACGLLPGAWTIAASKPGYSSRAVSATITADGESHVLLTLDRDVSQGDDGVLQAEGLPVDGTAVLPLHEFDKSWTLLNKGSTTWSLGYAWVFVGGDPLQVVGEPPQVPVSDPILPGETWSPQLHFSAPLDEGSYRGYWQMQNEDGTRFGPRCWVDIKVVDTSPPRSEFMLAPAEPDGQDGWYITAPTLTISAESPDDPVSKIEYSLDGLAWLGYSGPVQLPPGKHSLAIVATDSHGNPEEPQSLAQVNVAGTVSNPDPADGAVGVPARPRLSWMNSATGVPQDVYLWRVEQDRPGTPIASNLLAYNLLPNSDLELGVTYNWQVVTKHQDMTIPGPVWSFVTQTGLVGLPAAKAARDGEPVELEGVVVTALFDDCIYVEAKDRSSGIRVNTEQDVDVGDVVTLRGVVVTGASWERTVEAESIVASGSDSVIPLSMTCRSIGGGSFVYDEATGTGQRGIAGATGLNNIGLLVETWGKVIKVGSGFFYIDDGSGAEDGSLFRGVRVQCDSCSQSAGPLPGQFVGVSGISSLYKANGFPRRLIRAVSVTSDVLTSTDDLASEALR